jgi:hypothetical protein
MLVSDGPADEIQQHVPRRPPRLVHRLYKHHSFFSPQPIRSSQQVCKKNMPALQSNLSVFN